MLCNGNWHSAGFTWDGEVIILGWEPGGGSLPECEATDPPVKKSAFFYDADTGAKLGQWTLPRPQSAAENCTIHNYNTVPLRNGRYVLVVGNYQAGTLGRRTSRIRPNPVTLGWSDPPPLVPTQLGGVWSTYWYNNILYESEITDGPEPLPLQRAETRSAIKAAAPEPADAGVLAAGAVGERGNGGGQGAASDPKGREESDAPPLTVGVLRRTMGRLDRPAHRRRLGTITPRYQRTQT